MRDINFFNSIIENDKKNHNKLFGGIVISLIVISVISYSLYLYFDITKKYKSEIDRYNKFLSTSENSDDIKEISDIQSIINAMDRYNEFTNKVVSILSNNDKIKSKILNVLSDSLPLDIVIEDLSLSENRIEFSGISESEISIAQFQNNLNESKDLESVHIYIIQREENKTLNFSGECIIKGDENESFE